MLREVLRQKHAQQGRQRDRGQDHGKRASPGKETASARRPRERRLCSPGDFSQHVTHFNWVSSVCAQHGGFVVLASNGSGWINCLTEFT